MIPLVRAALRIGMAPAWGVSLSAGVCVGFQAQKLEDMKAKEPLMSPAWQPDEQNSYQF